MKRIEEILHVAILVLYCFLIHFSGAQKCFKVFSVKRRTRVCSQLIRRNVNFDDCCLKYKGGGYSEGRSRKNCQPCRATPDWDPWGSWSECSTSCGQGVQTRVRTCPADVKCTGDKDEFKACHMPPCPVDGGWTEWSEWSACSITCGKEGYHRSSRRCINPKPAHGGKRCKGKIEKFKKCENIPVNCPINGQWGPWGRPSVCVKIDNSTSCLGKQTRTRQCNSPPPQYGGEDCDDSVTGSQDNSYCKVTDNDCDSGFGDLSGSGQSGSGSGEFIDSDTESEDYVLDEAN